MPHHYLNPSADPLAVVTAPPPDETDEERATREAEEVEAKRVSDLIDEGLKKEKAAWKKEKDSLVKLLLLGQSESGKSTTLKNFQLKYTLKAWRAERTAWRVIIQLNLIRSVVTILEVLQEEMNGTPFISGAVEDDVDEQEAPSNPTPIQFTDRHQLLKLRLTPLRRVEADLKRRVGAEADEIDNLSTPMYATPFDASSSRTTSPRKRVGEFVVKSWKHVLERNQERTRVSPDSEEATEVIAKCREDIKALWGDAIVQDMLVKRNIRLADSADFFLGAIDRIATRTYEPSDDDIVRARLRTVGVQEHRLKFEGGPAAGLIWAIYDVGGSRTSRAAWVPYFDDVTAIIFLAPISCFDELLAEDNRVNRLEDSFILWRSICSSKLLAKATLILFLNKCDLLEKKIKRKDPIKINRYLPSYGDRPNESVAFIKYLRQKFTETSMECSPYPRQIYPFATSVTDTKATGRAIQSVQEGIVQKHLKDADLA